MSNRPNLFPELAAHEAARLGVHPRTLQAAIRAGECRGEERGGRWYTSAQAASDWYNTSYRHRRTLYSQRAGSVWRPEELTALRRGWAEGQAVEEIAAALKRSPGSCKVKASKLGLCAAPAPSYSQPSPSPVQSRSGAGLLPAYQHSRQEVVRQMERDGRVRLHLHPTVKRALGEAARRAGLTLAAYLTYAGLAAAADPEILKQGLAEAKTL